MKNREDFHHDDLLERAVDAILRDPIPGELPPDQVAQLVAAVRQAADKPYPITLIERIENMKLKTRIAVAAAVLIAVIGLMYWLVPGGGAGVAFADVAEALNNVHSATWNTTSVFEDTQRPAHKTLTFHTVKMFLAPSHERTEMTVEGGKPGKKSDRKSIQIVDGQTGTVICLMPGTKTAVVQNFKNLPPKSAIGGTFQSLRELVVNAQSGKAGKVERLGAKTIDGHAAEGFRIQVGVMDTKIWADPKTLLPIRVEEACRSGTGFKVSRVMTDFQTNVDLDKSLFSLDVPPGYTVPQTSGVKEAPSAEAPKLPEPKAGAKPQDHRGDAATATIAWGDTVKDLQLGLARQAETNAPAVTVSDGSSVLVQVSLRNTGKSPIRLLASVHTCLLGEGGSNALLVSRLVLKPKAGGDPFSMVYKAWNHLSLLDKRRPKSEQPQQTLNGSYGKTDIQLNPDDAKRMTTVLASGETRVAHVAFTLRKNESYSWQLEKSKSVPPGTYEVTAVLKVDQELSEWKGELTSGPIEVTFPQRVGK